MYEEVLLPYMPMLNQLFNSLRGERQRGAKFVIMRCIMKYLANKLEKEKRRSMNDPIFRPHLHLMPLPQGLQEHSMGMGRPNASHL